MHMSFWGGKRVVITGGHGFLGTHVAERLQERDCAEVFRARQRDYDLTREEDAARLFVDHPADIVIHLAGLVGGIGANKAYPADFFYRNLMMGTHTLHQAWKAGVQKLIAAGAGCGYPEDAPIPIRESDFWNGFPQIHSAPYSLAKRMLHVQSMAYWTQYRFPILVAIPGNIYGPYDNFDLEAAHVVPALVRKFVAAKEDGAAEVEVWGSGQPTRDFVYAADVAEGMLRMLEH
jgi:GDP-L-fucose synthase